MRPPAEAIGSLGLVVGVIASLILVGVEAALIYAAWRYRATRMPAMVPQVQGHRVLEITWTAIPVLILAVVFVLMLATMREIGASVPGGTSPAAMRVLARGYQWWWEFRYPSPGGDIVVANELHIPTNTAVDVDLESADVVHSFWVPALSGKTDMIPGRTNRLRLYASRPGTYVGQCAEFCGVEHAWMRITVIAQPAAEFERWLAAQGAPRRAEPATSRGEQVFLANVCTSCHVIRGTAAGGTAGPDLTHIGSRATLAAGALKNDAAAMRAWLADPQRHKPGALMPRVPLPDADLDVLVAYLGSLK